MRKSEQVSTFLAHKNQLPFFFLCAKYGPKVNTIEGLRAKRAYIEFWPIFIFCRIELIFGRLTCFDMKSIVP